MEYSQVTLSASVITIVTRRPCPQKLWFVGHRYSHEVVREITQSHKQKTPLYQYGKREREHNFNIGSLSDLHACKVALHEKK